LKSIFDTKKKNDNSTNKGIEDRQKRIERIKQDVDKTVVTFSKAIAKANDTNTKANDTSSSTNTNTNSNSNRSSKSDNSHDTTNFICCHRCTYHNATTAIECNMCGMTLETYYKNSTSSINSTPSSSTKKDNNNVEFASPASVAVAAQLPPTCVVESILRDDDDVSRLQQLDGAVVDFPIRCPVCTLDNHPGSSSCEACGSELSSDSIRSYERITQVHNTNTNSNSSSKKKRNSNNSNNSSSTIPEAIVIPMSGNGISIVEAFPIDDQHR